MLIVFVANPVRQCFFQLFYQSLRSWEKLYREVRKAWNLEVYQKICSNDLVTICNAR